FLAVGLDEPEPVVSAATDEILVLLDEQAAFVVAIGDDFEAAAIGEETLLARGEVDEVHGAGSSPRGADEIKPASIGRKLRTEDAGDDLMHVLGVAPADEHRGLATIA